MTSQAKKNILLVSLSVLLLVAAWKFAIAKTFAVAEEIQSIDKELNNLPSREKIGEIQEKNRKLDSILSLTQLKNLQTSILNAIKILSENRNTEIVDLDEPLTYSGENSLYITSYLLTLKGNYKNLEKALFKLEQKSFNGTIRNLRYQKVKDFETGKEHLECQLLLSFVQKDSLK